MDLQAGKEYVAFLPVESQDSCPGCNNAVTIYGRPTQIVEQHTGRRPDDQLLAKLADDIQTILAAAKVCESNKACSKKALRLRTKVAAERRISI